MTSPLQSLLASVATNAEAHQYQSDMAGKLAGDAMTLLAIIRVMEAGLEWYAISNGNLRFKAEECLDNANKLASGEPTPPERG